MNIKLVVGALWTVCAFLAGGGWWTLRAGLTHPEPVDLEVTLYDPKVIEGITVDYNANLHMYSPVEALSLKWVPVKPPPTDSPTSVERFKPPLTLTRVINQKLVQLMDGTNNSKTFYNVGEAILQRVGTTRKPVGKVLELDTSDSKRAVLKIEYMNPQTRTMEPFDLAMETSKAPIKTHVQKKLKMRKLKIGNPNSLEEHEGKEVGKNEYELNFEFYNAVFENSLAEQQKADIEFEQDGKPRITRLAEDSVLRKIGIKEQDQLLSVDGDDIKGEGDFILKMGRVWASDSPVRFQIRRSGQVETYTLKRLKNEGAFKEKYE